MASTLTPTKAEAATPTTGDGLGVSTSSKDNFDGGYLHLIVR